MKSNLLQEIEAEIADERFVGLIHGTRNVAAIGGCHGPLCRKYHRDKARKARAKRRGEPVPPSSDPLADAIIEHALADHVRKIMAERAEEIINGFVAC